MEIREYDVVRAMNDVKSGQEVLRAGTQADVVHVDRKGGRSMYVLEFVNADRSAHHFVDIEASDTKHLVLLARGSEKYSPPLPFGEVNREVDRPLSVKRKQLSHEALQRANKSKKSKPGEKKIPPFPAILKRDLAKT